MFTPKWRTDPQMPLFPVLLAINEQTETRFFRNLGFKLSVTIKYMKCHLIKIEVAYRIILEFSTLVIFPTLRDKVHNKHIQILTLV